MLVCYSIENSRAKPGKQQITNNLREDRKSRDVLKLRWINLGQRIMNSSQGRDRAVRKCTSDINFTSIIEFRWYELMMAQHHMSIAKAAFAASLLRPDVTKINRDDIARFHQDIEACLSRCTAKTIEVCANAIDPQSAEVREY